MAHNDYVGQTINGKYNVVRLIGRGGIGAVFVAHHIVSNEPVAIKFIHSQYAEKQDLLRRFYQEAQSSSQIGHPNIPQIYDMGVSEAGEPFLVMEYLEGESLASFMSRSGPVSLEVTCAVMEPVLLALEAAHNKGIVHRYLKPENIFILNQVNGQPLIKLSDFGVSRFTNPDNVDMTQYGVTLGTPVYLSPEQIKGASNIDNRADLYSVGVLMYKMLTGKVPFKGNYYHEILIATTSYPPLPPFEAYPSFPQEAEILIMRCLEKNPQNRPESAREILHCMKVFSGFKKRNESLLAAVTKLTMGTVIGKGSTVIGELSEDFLDAAAVAAAAKRKASANRDFPSTSNSSPTGKSSRSPSSSARGAAARPAKQRHSGSSRKQPASLPHRVSVGSRGSVWGRQNKLIVISAIAGGALLLAVIVAFALSHRENTNGSSDFSEGKSIDSAPNNNQPQRLGESQDFSGNNVQIEVRGLPENAKIMYNGIPIPANPFKVESRDSIVQMKVEAPGYKPFVTAVVPSEDQVVVVSMTPQNAISDTPLHDVVEQQLSPDDEEEVPPSHIESRPQRPAVVNRPSIKKDSDLNSLSNKENPPESKRRKKNTTEKKNMSPVNEKKLIDIHDVFD